jgi:hypothetical protein
MEYRSIPKNFIIHYLDSVGKTFEDFRGDTIEDFLDWLGDGIKHFPIWKPKAIGRMTIANAMVAK